MDRKQRHYALLGRGLGHSSSPRWFTALFERLGLKDFSYGLHDVENLDGLRQWIEAERVCGFNVTAPYKCSIVALMDSLSPEAEAVGAVNCVVVGEDGRLHGHNTDCQAFYDTLAQTVAQPFDVACVLGTGGAARAVVWALSRGLAKRSVMVSRSGARQGVVSYAEAASMLSDASRPLLVNATPVGMWPAVEANPWEGFCVADGWMVYDLIYNPSPTRLLRQAEACGAAVRDGYAMFCRQAELSWRLWAETTEGMLRASSL